MTDQFDGNIARMRLGVPMNHSRVPIKEKQRAKSQVKLEREREEEE
jgi:hypothetical protein